MVYLSVITRWFVGLTFLTAALDKVDDWSDTKQAIEGYGIFSARSIGAWVTSLVIWEGTLAFLLLSGLFHQLASMLAGITYLGFAALLIYRLKTRRETTLCGCGGIFGNEEVSWWLVARSFFLSGISITGAVSPLAWPTDWLPAVLTAVGVAMLIWLFTTLKTSFDLALQQRKRLGS